MITSLFRKSTPLNLFLIVFLVLLFFFLYQIQDISWTKSIVLILERLAVLISFLGTIFLTNYISKQTRISSDSRFVKLLFLFLVLFFPPILTNFLLILANFCVLMGVRILVSPQVLINSKEKIFDASLWIFLATAFHFWSILYLVLVFFAIIVHVANDYRNWLLPLIASLAVVILFSIIKILYNINIENYFNKNVATDFEIDYFTNNFQNAALAIYATISLYFIGLTFFHLSNISLNLHVAISKIIISFFIGILVYLVSPNKSNEILIFTIGPLAILATSIIEILKVKIEKELILLVLITCSLFSFFNQL